MRRYSATESSRTQLDLDMLDFVGQAALFAACLVLIYRRGCISWG